MSSYNRFARLQELYFSQSRDYVPERKNFPADSLFQWPQNNYLNFNIEKELINETIESKPYEGSSLAEEVFGRLRAGKRLI